jgi:hypothetical protein
VREMDSNEDLRAERTRYYERYAFPLFSHIDFRVSDPRPCDHFTTR